MADPLRQGQSAGHEPKLTENPKHPEQANEQDLGLEAQIDALLRDLEAVDPQSVPEDLRKNTEGPTPAAPEPVQATPAEPEPQAEPVSQPAPIAAEDTAPTDTPAKKELDLESIASMASNMLDQQIEATLEAASDMTGSADTKPQTTADEPAAAAEPKPSGGLSEDELSDQINAMLNSVQAQSAQAEPTPEPASQPEPVEPQPIAATPVDAAADSTAGESEESTEPTEAGAVSIQQIDAMLADSAEKAIESEPETTEHVPGTDEILAAQAKAEAAEAEAKANAEPQPIPQPTPQPAATQPQPAQSFEAGADDVARELNEDAQPEPATAEPEPAPANSAVFESTAAETSQASAANTQPDDVPEPQAVTINEAGVKKAQLTLLRICGKINSPLYRLSPEMRDLVGWVGVVTLGLGLFMFLFGIIF